MTKKPAKSKEVEDHKPTPKPGASFWATWWSNFIYGCQEIGSFLKTTLSFRSGSLSNQTSKPTAGSTNNETPKSSTAEAKKTSEIKSNQSPVTANNQSIPQRVSKTIKFYGRKWHALLVKLRPQDKQQFRHGHPNRPVGFWRRLVYWLHPWRQLRFWFSWRGFGWLMRLILLCLIITGTATGAIYLNYREDLPTIADLRSCLQGQTTKYYDRTGQTLLWASKSDVDCQAVELDQISPYLIKAVIAAEDDNFYNHNGFEPRSIARAAWNNVRGREIQGASTITQQYIKNAVLQDRQRNFERKIRELILAIELDRKFTKDEVLAAYLNTIAFGSIYQGVEASAQGYFDKSAAELTLAESALLVAAIPAPSSYWANPERHLARQHQVLNLMYQAGSISRQEMETAKGVDILASVRRSHQQYENIIAPHFVLEAERRLKQRYQDQKVRTMGLKVITTIDLRAQELAQESIETGIDEVTKRGFDNAASVAVEVSTGKVLAQMGSRDFDFPVFGQTNTVTMKRSPGSAFKVFDYASLIENTADWGPGSTFYDYETLFDVNQDYRPTNYSGNHAGPITMRLALGDSLNIPAIKAMYIVGRDKVHDLANKAGLRSELDCGGYCGLSTAIGGGVGVRLDELTNAYATFARQGTYLPLTYIDRIYDKDNRLIHQWRPQPEKVISTETSYLMTHMLSDNAARYTQVYNLDGIVAGIKTGTTDYYRNNHVIAYSKKVAYGVWIGHHDIRVKFTEEPYTNRPKAIILKSFMEPYHVNLPASDRNNWAAPGGIQRVRIDLKTGYQVLAPVPNDEQSLVDPFDINPNANQVDRPDPEAWKRGTAEDVFPSWYRPRLKPSADNQVPIDIVSLKRATDCTPVRALGLASAFPILPELPSTDPYYSIWMEPINTALGLTANIREVEGYDDIHQCDDVLPSIELSGPQICQQSCRILAIITPGTHPIDQVNFMVGDQILPNGQVEIDSTERPIEYIYHPEESLDSVVFKAEVVDQALYDASDHISFKTTVNGDLIVDEIVVDSFEINSSGLSLEFSWNQPVAGLKAQFGGVCQVLPTVDLPTNRIFFQVDKPPTITDGYCRLELINQASEIVASRQLVIGPVIID